MVKPSLSERLPLINEHLSHHLELLDYLNHPAYRLKSDGIFSKQSKRKIEVMLWELIGLMDRIVDECLQELGLGANGNTLQ